MTSLKDTCHQCSIAIMKGGSGTFYFAVVQPIHHFVQIINSYYNFVQISFESAFLVELLEDQQAKRYPVYGGTEEWKLTKGNVVSWKNAANIIDML